MDETTTLHCQRSRTTFTCLYIGDNDADIRLAEAILEENRPNVRLIIAKDGDTAVALLENQNDADSPDVVITDMNVAGALGPDQIHRIRGIDHCRALPIIVFSGLQSEMAIRECVERGATAYVTKACDLDAITASLTAIVDQFCGTSSAAG